MTAAKPRAASAAVTAAARTSWRRQTTARSGGTTKTKMSRHDSVTPSASAASQCEGVSPLERLDDEPGGQHHTRGVRDQISAGDELADEDGREQKCGSDEQQRPASLAGEADTASGRRVATRRRCVRALADRHERHGERLAARKLRHGVPEVRVHGVRIAPVDERVGREMAASSRSLPLPGVWAFTCG